LPVDKATASLKDSITRSANALLKKYNDVKIYIELDNRGLSETIHIRILPHTDGERLRILNKTEKGL